MTAIEVSCYLREYRLRSSCFYCYRRSPQRTIQPFTLRDQFGIHPCSQNCLQWNESCSLWIMNVPQKRVCGYRRKNHNMMAKSEFSGSWTHLSLSPCKTWIRHVPSMLLIISLNLSLKLLIQRIYVHPNHVFLEEKTHTFQLVQHVQTAAFVLLTACFLILVLFSIQRLLNSWP